MSQLYRHRAYRAQAAPSWFHVDLAATGLQAIIKGQQPNFTLEYSCQSPTELRWFLMHAMPLSNHGGIVVAHENITVRKQAEQALRESEARYRGWCFLT